MTSWGHWSDLIESYKEELRDLNARKRTYQVPLKVLEDKKKRKEFLTDEELVHIVEYRREISLLSQMVTSTTYALKWLQDGKCPDNVTSIENYSYDQRTIEVDPKLLEVIYSTEDTLYQEQEEVDQELLFKLESALSTLTDKEKEAFILFEGQQFSIGNIAEYMKVKPSTVNTMLRRARHKIKVNKDSDIFLLEGVL